MEKDKGFFHADIAVENLKLPVLSIIVPVYNVENYIRRCLDSILVQTFTDWECILIDDGSTDKSGEICDWYAVRDKRFKVLHKKNGGPGKARNFGIGIALGKWIGFVDSDDWIEKETYETVLEVAEAKKADLVQWEFIREYPEGSVLNKCKPDSFFTSAQSSEYYHSSVWASIFKRQIIKENSILFTETSVLSEDTLFNYQYYLKAKNCYYVGKCFYHYSQNSSSIIHNVTKEMIFKKKKIVDKISELAEIGGGIGYVKNIKRNAKFEALAWRKVPDFKLFRELYPEIKYKDLVSEEMSFKAKFYFLLIYCHLDFLAFLLWKIFRSDK